MERDPEAARAAVRLTVAQAGIAGVACREDGVMCGCECGESLVGRIEHGGHIADGMRRRKSRQPNLRRNGTPHVPQRRRFALGGRGSISLGGEADGFGFEVFLETGDAVLAALAALLVATEG